jgi:hypothetical protein
MTGIGRFNGGLACASHSCYEQIMMIKRFIRCIPCRIAAALAFFILTAVSIAAAEGDWKLVLHTSGVDVSTRTVAGSDLDEFQGSTVVEAPVSVIEAVLDDVPASSQWMSDCKEARIVRVIDANTLILINVTKTPWPVYDREALLLLQKKHDQKSGSLIYEFHSIEDPSVPVGKWHVRIPAVTGRWVLTPLEQGHTRATYTVKTDPGGYIPKTMANRASRNIPFETLLGLKKMVQRDKYRRR